MQQITVAIPGTSIPSEGYHGLLAIAQFAPAQGEYLTQIDFELAIDFAGMMGFENLNPSLSTFFKLELTWLLEVDLPAGEEREGPLLDMSATRGVVGLAGPFDGAVDFAGPSGRTYAVAANGVAAFATTADASDLAAFTGNGVVELPIAGWFEGFAQAQTDHESDFWDVGFAGELTVTYTYVPEPAGLALLLIGPLLLWRFRR